MENAKEATMVGCGAGWRIMAKDLHSFVIEIFRANDGLIPK